MGKGCQLLSKCSVVVIYGLMNSLEILAVCYRNLEKQLLCRCFSAILLMSRMTLWQSFANSAIAGIAMMV
jgi:hypothetical protein